MLDIPNTIQHLATERPLFHSEADFQHALAWKIHQQWPDARIRLETPSGHPNRRERIDILVLLNGSIFAIELKYKKQLAECTVDGEVFSLTKDGAHDIARYDFIKDVVRLETFVKNKRNAMGYAILLTNDNLLWDASQRGQFSASFFIHEGRQFGGGTALAWHEKASDGTTKGRTNALEPADTYTAIWKDYSAVPNIRYGRFRYLMLAINTR